MNKTVREFFKSIDRTEFEAETGFITQSVTRAIGDGLMPAGWYIGVRDFCAKREMPVPDHLFRWSDKRKAPEKEPDAA